MTFFILFLLHVAFAVQGRARFAQVVVRHLQLLLRRRPQLRRQRREKRVLHARRRLLLQQDRLQLVVLLRLAQRAVQRLLHHQQPVQEVLRVAQQRVAQRHRGLVQLGRRVVQALLDVGPELLLRELQPVVQLGRVDEDLFDHALHPQLLRHAGELTESVTLRLHVRDAQDDGLLEAQLQLVAVDGLVDVDRVCRRRVDLRKLHLGGGGLLARLPERAGRGVLLPLLRIVSVVRHVR